MNMARFYIMLVSELKRITNSKNAMYKTRLMNLKNKLDSEKTKL